MQKTADTQHPIVELLARRWSPLSFDSRPVPREALVRLFEAARWAASSYNEQPWTYIVGIKDENPEQFEKLAGVLVPQNSWAKGAPVLMLSIAKQFFSRDHSPNAVAFHDVGAASAGLAIQATAEGLALHQMRGFDADKARAVFGIPEGYDAVAMLALGYAGEPDQLEPGLRDRERATRQRKPISEFVLTGAWGGPGFQP